MTVAPWDDVGMSPCLDHRVADLVAQPSDPRLEVRLVLLGGVILAVLLEVAPLACGLDPRRDGAAALALELVELRRTFSSSSAVIVMALSSMGLRGTRGPARQDRATARQHRPPLHASWMYRKRSGVAPTPNVEKCVTRRSRPDPANRSQPLTPSNCSPAPPDTPA